MRYHAARPLRHMLAGLLRSLKDIAICLVPLRRTAEEVDLQETQSSDKVAPAVSQETVQKVSFVARADCLQCTTVQKHSSIMSSDGWQAGLPCSMFDLQSITSQAMIAAG